MLKRIKAWIDSWRESPVENPFENLYASPDRIVDEVVTALTPEELAILKLSSKHSMIRYHHTVGRFIRNRYRLWDEENPYTDASDPSDDRHPDQVSHIVLEKVWDRVHAK